MSEANLADQVVQAFASEIRIWPRAKLTKVSEVGSAFGALGCLWIELQKIPEIAEAWERHKARAALQGLDGSEV